LAVAHDLFVHHFGSRTFVGNNIEAQALLEENARRFAAKWGQAVPEGRRVALRPWGGPAELHTRTPRDRQPEPGTVYPSAPPGQGTSPSVVLFAAEPGHDGQRTTDNEQRARVSLTLIVRNEQDNLPRCLESVRGLFDEIVVVDTGSTDATRAIAAEFGARVFDFAWIGDFAAARNAALAQATGDYVFWLDADDVIEPGERAKLERLLGGLSQSPQAGYVVRCACDPSSDGSGGEVVVDHIRLFPLRDDVRWTYRVHEQIVPALKRAGIPLLWTDLTVRHLGYIDPSLRARKLERDAGILHQELKDRPDDPFVLFNLGAIAIEWGDGPQALEYLLRRLSRSAPSDSITRKLFVLIARAHQMTGDTGAALRSCAEGLPRAVALVCGGSAQPGSLRPRHAWSVGTRKPRGYFVSVPSVPAT
jgi:hypothetical protein